MVSQGSAATSWRFGWIYNT